MKTASYAIPVMSTVSSIAIEKCSNLDDAAFNCCFKSPDISSIRSATVFLVSEISWNKCAFSGHNLSRFYKALLYEISFTVRFPTHGDHSAEFIACSNGSDIPFLNFRKTGLLLSQVSLQFLES